MKETALIVEYVAKENPRKKAVVRRLKNGTVKVVVELTPGKLEELLTSPMGDEERRPRHGDPDTAAAH